MLMRGIKRLGNKSKVFFRYIFSCLFELFLTFLLLFLFLLFSIYFDVQTLGVAMKLALFLGKNQLLFSELVSCICAWSFLLVT